MIGRLILLGFAAITLIEIALFILIGQAIGVLPTLLGTILMALLGAAIIRRQGLSLLAEVRNTMGQGRLPARSLGDAMLISIAGVLLMIPGYFTDAIGLLLLIPLVRTGIYRFIGRRVGVVDIQSTVQTTSSGPAVIELDETHFRPR